MRALRATLFCSALLLALSIALCALDVHTDYNHDVNFSQFHTYSWAKVKTDDPLWQPRVQQAIDNALQGKGWQRVDSGGDVTVAAVGSVHNQREYQTFYDGMGGWRWGGWGGTRTTTVQNYRVGTLLVDLYDTSTKQLIWRGNSSESLSGDPEKNEKKLQKDVDKLFNDFPPKEKHK